MNRNKKSFKKDLILILKGIAMGAANKVPGVSGGIVAFVAGFYEELIYSLQKINFKAFMILINKGWNSFCQYINGRFLILLFSEIIPKTIGSVYWRTVSYTHLTLPTNREV